jgi:hypothetical protein
MVQWVENVEAFRKFISRTWQPISALYIGILAIEVGVAASALPNVYVADVGASCGARFIVHFAVKNLVTAGVAIIVLVALGGLFEIGAAFLKQHETRVRSWFELICIGAIMIFGFPTIFFFIFVASQTAVLLNPPSLPSNPQDIKACISMGDYK